MTILTNTISIYEKNLHLYGHGHSLGGVQAHAQHFVTTVEQANALVASPARVVQAAPGSIWRHKTGVHYTTKDNGATWTKIGDIAFSYDTKGNLLSQKETNAVSGGIDLTEYTYDAQGHNTSSKWTINDTPDAYNEYFYDDPILKDLCMGGLSYSYDEATKKWINPKEKNRLSFTRNSQNNITEVNKKDIVYDGTIHIDKLYNTYDKSGTKLTNMVTTSYSSSNGETRYDKKAFDLVWYKTNGQVYDFNKVCCLSLELEEDKDNLLKSGNIYTLTPDGTGVSNIYTLKNTYDGKGGYVRETESYFKDLERTKKTVSDDGTEHYIYESYKDYNSDGTYSSNEIIEKRETVIKTINGKRLQEWFMSYDYNEDGTEKSRYKLTSTHDEHGNNTIYEAFWSFDQGKTWVIARQGERYTYEYDEATGEMLSALTERYNTETQQYEKRSKYVYSQIEDVATAIDQPSADNGEAPTAVYNLQGVYMGATTDQLPTGIYLVKQGGTTHKVLKR